jgi:Na+/melibiose symporter-like transporter
MQPLIGALSDRSTSRFGRRRPFIAVGSVLVCCSLLGVAFARDIAAFMIRISGKESEDHLRYAVRRYIGSIIHYQIVTNTNFAENHSHCTPMAS